MINMSYCRFSNTVIALQECVDKLQQCIDKQDFDDISEPEQKSSQEMYDICLTYIQLSDEITDIKGGV